MRHIFKNLFHFKVEVTFKLRQQKMATVGREMKTLLEQGIR